MAASTLIQPTRRSRTPTTAVPRLRSQVARFAVIGVGCTLLNLGLLAALAGPLGAQRANLVALVVSTVVNTAANRAWTFQVRGSAGLARHHVQSLVIFAITWAASSGALALLTLESPHPSTVATVVTVGVANALSTVVRFGAMRSWIFRPARAEA